MVGLAVEAGEHPVGLLVVTEHGRLEGKVAEAAQVGHHVVGRRREVLVAHQAVTRRSQATTDFLGPPYPSCPPVGRLGEVGGPEVDLADGQGHVPPVAHQVHEPGLGKDSGQQLDVLDVARRLVAVATLPLALGIHGVHAAHRISQVGRLGLGHLPPDGCAVEVPGREAGRHLGVVEEVGEEASHVEAVPAPCPNGMPAVAGVVVGHPGDEPGLVDNGQLGMGVEDGSQQRGAGTAHTDEEGEWGSGRARRLDFG